jgi:hypothetical protein
MVHDLSLDEYIFKIDIERLSQTSHAHNCTICFGLDMVSNIDDIGICISQSEEEGASIEERA